MTDIPAERVWLVGNSGDTYLVVEDIRGRHSWTLTEAQLAGLLADCQQKLSWRRPA